jgi:adenylate cyclase
MERRLAAILAADVVGYTRLMGEDEVGTLRRLTDLRREIIEPLIAEHHGRIVKLMGDGLLVEFASVVNTVACALAWQECVSEHEADSDADSRLQFRIGINLGDIIVEDNDIHGDGVNIAARLEGLAEPSGICLSADAFRQAKGKVAADFEDIGEQKLKNVAEPLRVYRLATDQVVEPAIAPQTAKLPLPSKPSVAVLPFTNMSSDIEQEYFSDGITEDIITDLSRFRSLFVIARNSSFHYKGQSPKVQDIGKELGVHYVVEGSVRKAGHRVRVTAQLVEAENGNHLWAERYDRDLEDIFALQDELVQTIVSTLGGHIDVAGKAHAARLDDANLQAYDLYLRARAAQDRNTKEDYELARNYLERAIALDPSFAQAHHGLSLVYFMQWMAHWVEDREAAFADSMEAAKKAVALDPGDSSVYSRLGTMYMNRREFEESGRNFRKAVALNPNDSQALALLGVYLTAVGEPEQAVEQFNQAMRLNPFEPKWFRWSRGIAYFTGRRYEEAISDFTSLGAPINEARGWLAASYAHANRPEEARATLEEFLQTAEREMAAFPGRNLSEWEAYWHGAIEYENEEHFQHLYNGLREAGLSD